jgi:hypothetical protein
LTLIIPPSPALPPQEEGGMINSTSPSSLGGGVRGGGIQEK